MIQFVSPSEYLQGPGVLSRLPAFTARAGAKPVIVVDARVEGVVAPLLAAAYGSDCTPPSCRIDGEVTREAIAALALALPTGASVVVGVGGGKAIDMAKGAACTRELPMISVPTVASNDAPTSRIFAVYDDDHRMVAVDRMPGNPLAVIVDTALLVRAPARMMRAGIGDAIAKTFEADAAWVAGGCNMLGSQPPAIGRAIARAAYDVIRKHAVAGIAAMGRGEPDATFEALVEACVLMSGLGFENGGLSVAHSVTRGLMQSRHGAGALHGEHVAYGLMVQIVVEGRGDAFADDLASFLTAVGLPTSLQAMSGRAASLEDFDGIAKATLAAPHLANFPPNVRQATLMRAMRAIEQRYAG